MQKWIIVAVASFLLCACNDKEELTSNKQSETGTVGFEVMDGEIIEIENIPEDEKKSILTAFDEYIASFNTKDINRYINTLSKNPHGFELEEEIETVKSVFKQYDIERVASNTTIVRYSENEAQVYANLNIEMKELKSNAMYLNSGRQVTVFVKEDGSWKVTRVSYMGDES